MSTSDPADQYADRSALLAQIGKLPRRQRAVQTARSSLRADVTGGQ